MTSAAYQLCARSFSNIPWLKSQGYIDLVLIENIAGSCPCCGVAQSFIDACTAAGMGSLLNNGNDAGGGYGTTGPGCGGYYAGLKAQGLSGAGGESEGLPEVQDLLAISGTSWVFMNYGGQGTGGPTGNNNIWANQGGHCSYSGGATISAGQKCSTFLEPYAPGLMSAQEVATEAVYNYDAGCFEVGLLVADWYADRMSSSAADIYISYADAMASAGVPCAGFQYWYVGGDSGGFYSKCMHDLMTQFPPSSSNILTRAGGSGGSTPFPTTGTEFSGYTEIDIVKWLAQRHNGIPTSGRHTIYVTLQSGSSTPLPVNVTVRVREHQPGRE
jgi:hypothetical protein